MPDEQHYEESLLLKLLAQDSAYAFQLIFDRYRNRIYKMAMLYVRSPALAEEIVQDVFLKLWFQRRNLAKIYSFEAWLITVSKNCIINSLRKIAREWKVREKWDDGVNRAGDDTDHRVRLWQYQSLLSAAIDRLPGQQQRIYRMVREQGLSYDAIGKELGLSPLTVKTHMARALKSLKAFFQQHGDMLLVPGILIPLLEKFIF
jgi:RNA polymerase sigma-70 factor (ECF subfamily)